MRGLRGFSATMGGVEALMGVCSVLLTTAGLTGRGGGGTLGRSTWGSVGYRPVLGSDSVTFTVRFGLSGTLGGGGACFLLRRLGRGLAVGLETNKQK